MFEITFLGTAASIPWARRSLPAALVKHQGQRFLVDCGEGTQLRLMQAGESLKVGQIFLTHDHLDHVLGLGGLLFSLSLLRMKPTPQVTIYGGHTTLDRAKTLASMVRSKTKSKAYVELDFIEISPGVVLENHSTRITAFPTNHRQRPCFGYVFESKGRKGVKVVFTGDTAYMDSLVDIAQGAHCLVAEATFAAGKQEQASRVGHLTAVQAAQLAAEAEVKSLLLNHVSRTYASDVTRVLGEAQALFPHTCLPDDLDRFEIRQTGVHKIEKYL